jgi:pyruvate/2-oxoglutarate dehydrogenase complex dihydrolipoamide dehydrogenase (E3) component
MPTRFDAIVVGTGQAGPSLAQRLSAAGMSVAVIERKRFGGTCVNTGCIPTKTLIASARAAWVASRAADYGVVVDGAVRVDMRKVKARKDAVAGPSEIGIHKMLIGLKDCRVVEGHARFAGPNLVRVGEDTLEAPRIFINVGARAAVPRIPGLHEVPYLTNSSMMDVDYLPEHLLILGGSYIGLEFAQMYRRFGSDVTVFERASHLLSREDEDIAKSVREILEAEGIRVFTNARGIALSHESGRITVRSEAGEATGSHVLLALGRIPNTDDLGLDNAGIAVDSHGYIQVDDELRTSAPGVWAMGDCNGKGAFTHTSYNDYEIVAANLLDGGSRRVSDRIPAYNVYTDPPLARVGLSEREVRASGRAALMATRPMTKVGRAAEKGETRGFLKILADAENHRILGACLLGVECDETVHCILDIMYAKAPYETIQRAVHIHPTVSELIPTLLGDLKPL